MTPIRPRIDHSSAYEEHASRLPQPIRKRCTHVVTENARTVAAARALSANILSSLVGSWPFRTVRCAKTTK